MSDPDTLRRLWRYKSDLEEGPDEEKLIQILRKLLKLQVSISNLQETGIGKVVNTFRHQEGVVGDLAKKVVAAWKTSVQQEIQKQPSSDDDNDGNGSDRSDNSWASWDGERGIKIKQEKHEDRNLSRGENSRNDKSHRKMEKHKEKVRIKKDRDGDDEKRRQRDKDENLRIKKEKTSDNDDKEETRSDRFKDLNEKREKDNDVKNGCGGGGDDDLTDSDEEPEQSTSDRSSIEQYYKAMLGRVKNENVGRGDKNKKEDEKKYAKGKNRSESELKNQGKHSTSSKECGGESRKSHSEMGRSTDKSKSSERMDGLKHAKVDRRKKNHSVSESDSEEEVSQNENDRGDNGKDVDRSKDRKSSDSKSSHHTSLKESPLTSVSDSMSSQTKAPSISAHAHSSSHRSKSSSKPSSSSSKPSSSKSSSSSSKPSSSSKSSHHNSSSSSSSHSRSHSSIHSKSSSASLSSSSKNSSDHAKSSSSHHSKSSSSSSKSKSSSHFSSSKNEIIGKSHDESVPPYIPTPVKIKTEKLDKYDQTIAEYSPTSTGFKGRSHHTSDDEGENYSLNPYVPNKKMKREKEDTDSSDPEDSYIPTKKLKTEKFDTDSFNSGNSYEPGRKIKEEKSFSPSADYIPSEKKKSEKGVQSSCDSDGNRHGDDDCGDGGDGHKNKYLEAIGRVQSSDGDEDRYSPTHGWRVKVEKTCDDYKYGGRGDWEGEGSGSVNENSGSEIKNDDLRGQSFKAKEKGLYSSSNSDGIDGSGDRQYSKSEKGDKSEERKDKRKSREDSSGAHHSGSSGSRHSSKNRSERSHNDGKHRSRDSSTVSSKSESSPSGGKSHSKDSKVTRDGQKGQSASLHKFKMDGNATTKHNASKTTLSAKQKSHNPSTSSSSSSKTSEQPKKKLKPKPKPELEADFGLFSETIQIKQESSSTPRSSKDDKKRPSSSGTHRTSDKIHTASGENSRTKKTDMNSTHKVDEISHKYSVEDTSKSSELLLSSSSLSSKNHEKIVDQPQKVKKKQKEEVRIDDSEMSFDDFLNFDEAAVLKKGSTKTSSTKSHSSSKTSKPSSSSSSSKPTGHSSATIPSQPDLPLPKPTSQMKLTEADFMSLLPATQAHYRPVRRNPLYENNDDGDNDQTPAPTISDMEIGTKTTSRYKVYSGKKHVIKELKSLHELCLYVLMDNIDAMDCVGPIPYFILKPVLERCTYEQLYRLEDYNPHFIEDSEELWEIHCKKEFMESEPEELETWRELFLRKFEEREAKYQKLKAKMTLTTVKGQAGRPAKLAYVDAVAKPPREVLRQQKRYGTGCVMRTKVRNDGERTGSALSSVKSYKPSLTVAAHNPMNEGPRVYRPTPPMMAKALQMRKNMRR